MIPRVITDLTGVGLLVSRPASFAGAVIPRLPYNGGLDRIGWQDIGEECGAIHSGFGYES
jgi:hypothetical protein